MQLTPSSFLQAIRSGVNPHVALIEWGRQRKQETEKMRKIRLEPARNTGPISLEAIENEPTMLMPIFNLSKGEFGLPVEEIERLVQDSPNLYSQKVKVVQEEDAIKPAVRIDKKNRLYVAALNPFEDVVRLTRALVKRYEDVTNTLPAIILLPTALAYLTRPADYFISGDVCMPYIYDPYVHDDAPDITFDVMVRCRDGETWVL